MRRSRPLTRDEAVGIQVGERVLTVFGWPMELLQDNCECPRRIQVCPASHVLLFIAQHLASIHFSVTVELAVYIQR